MRKLDNTKLVVDEPVQDNHSHFATPKCSQNTDKMHKSYNQLDAKSDLFKEPENKSLRSVFNRDDKPPQSAAALKETENHIFRPVINPSTMRERLSPQKDLKKTRSELNSAFASPHNTAKKIDFNPLIDRQHGKKLTKLSEHEIHSKSQPRRFDSNTNLRHHANRESSDDFRNTIDIRADAKNPKHQSAEVIAGVDFSMEKEAQNTQHEDI